jgi:hypothetical protein
MQALGQVRLGSFQILLLLLERDDSRFQAVDEVERCGNIDDRGREQDVHQDGASVEATGFRLRRRVRFF